MGNQERIIFISPLSIYDFHNLIAKSYLILTDSRGIQEKAPSLNVPVVILGKATERPEGIETGASVLVGTKPDNIYTKVYDLLTNPVVYGVPPTKREFRTLRNFLFKKLSFSVR
ncbi:UDP-N-acetylglucosamine 2-epimerase [Bacillus thuringiensis]|uniref:UDP-N-acetylglucosamine 2-epimerase n=1 Tax=Bacillus thuringiensis TaxID=1428 RepID=UPI003BF63D17